MTSWDLAAEAQDVVNGTYANSQEEQRACAAWMKSAGARIASHAAFLTRRQQEERHIVLGWVDEAGNTRADIDQLTRVLEDGGDLTPELEDLYLRLTQEAQTIAGRMETRAKGLDRLGELMANPRLSLQNLLNKYPALRVAR